MSAPMIVGLAPAKVGHRQTPYTQKPPLVGGFCFGARESALVILVSHLSYPLVEASILTSALLYVSCVTNIT